MQRTITMAVAAVVAGMGISQIASGADTYYTGAAGAPGTTTQWGDSANWLNGTLPGPDDAANFVSPFNGTVALGEARTVGSVYWNPSAENKIIGSDVQPLTITTGNLVRGSAHSAVQRFDVPIILGTGSSGAWVNTMGIGHAGFASFFKPITGDATLQLLGPATFLGGETTSVFELNSTARFTLNGLKITRGASLRVAPNASVDRLADSMSVEIENGDMLFSGSAPESVGDFIYSGESYLRLANGANVDLASLNRINNGVLTIRSGSSANVMGTDLKLTVAGGVPAPSGMVAPSIVRRMTDNIQDGDTNFLDYDATQGFTDAVYTPRTDLDFSSSQPTEIVLLTKSATDQPSISSPLTIQALKITQSNTDVNGTGTLTISSGGIIVMEGDNDIRTPLQLGAEGVVYVNGPSYKTLNLAGPVAGTEGLTKHGMGSLGINSSDNTFTGPVTVLEGSFNINGSAASGDGVGLNRAGGVVLPLRVGAAGIFSANNRSQRVGGLDGTGRISGGTSATAGTMTIVRDNSAVSHFSGSFTASTMNVVKQGDGTQIFSGVLSNTGTTTIDAGVLQIDGTMAAGGAAVTVNAGGTLGGNGSIQRNVVSHGAIAPGASVGTLTVDSLALESGSVLDWEVGSDGTDLLTVTGLLDINGPVTLNISESGTLSEGQYTLIEFGSLDGSIGDISFGSVPSGFAYDLQQGTSSIDLVVAIPEPAGLALLGLAVPALLRRRRM